MPSSDKQNRQRQINLELREQEAEGTYANLAVITHSNSEFIIDFARIMPGVNKARIQSRIVMTPQNFKNLLRAIEDNIQKFEAQHGQIDEPGQPQPQISMEKPLDDDDTTVH